MASAEISLSKRQMDVIRTVLQKKNIFFTGDAGTGKSKILMLIIESVPERGTFITAWTGAAATKIGGQTFLSFMGIGLGDDTRENLLKKIGFAGRRNLQTADLLIIDEVSMLNADIFDKAEWIARQIRNCEEPFGGIQLVLAGDFYQIPPVKSTRLLFESSRWDACIPVVIELDEIFRQSEEKLITMLNEIRHDRCTPATLELIESLKRELEFDDGILPVEIYCTNVDVDRINTKRLALLDGEAVTFSSEDTGKPELLKDCLRPETLVLKIGAMVMHLENDREDRRLVNGSQGVVEKFINGLPYVRFDEGSEKLIDYTVWKKEVRGKTLATRSQLPIKLSWAVTAHKIQGQSLARLKIKCDDAFDYGIAYVMFSRARTLAGLQVIGFDQSKFQVNPKVRRFYKKIRAAQLKE